MENLKLSEQFLNIEEEEKESWKVTDDLSADFAIDKITEAQAEFNRFNMVAQAKLLQIQGVLDREKEKMEREVNFFEGKLREYFEKLDNHRETKTQLSYKLPSGTLKMKKSKLDFNYDKKALLEVAEKTGLDDYIKTKKEFDWATFKKGLAIKGDSIVDKESGEVIEIEGLSIIEKPEEFKVEVQE